MIDTFNDTTMLPVDAAKHVASITGQKANKNMIHRWMTRGVMKGKLRLKSFRIGGQPITSREALNEFLNQWQLLKTQRNSTVVSSAPIPTSDHQTIAGQAIELGILKTGPSSDGGGK